jgi:hypothetical protein
MELKKNLPGSRWKQSLIWGTKELKDNLIS